MHFCQITNIYIISNDSNVSKENIYHTRKIPNLLNFEMKRCDDKLRKQSVLTVALIRLLQRS